MNCMMQINYKWGGGGGGGGGLQFPVTSQFLEDLWSQVLLYGPLHKLYRDMSLLEKNVDMCRTEVQAQMDLYDDCDCDLRQMVPAC